MSEHTVESAYPECHAVITAIGERVWELAGTENAKQGHRDLVFGTCWQNVMWAVEQGVEDAYAAIPEDTRIQARVAVRVARVMFWAGAAGGACAAAIIAWAVTR